jgi:thiol:disulfide interchange protein
MRLASRVICLIVIASFVLFAVNQTSKASQGQQREVTGESAPVTNKPEHQSTLHKTIDEASDELTSPFAGITSESSNQWVIHGANLLLALLIYGLGLSFLARTLRL